jgi:hypothetical protein
MKPFVMIPLLGAALFTLGACQSPQRRHSDDFAQKTHRTYNPQTGSFEQSPPWGKQSNKDNTSGQ